MRNNLKWVPKATKEPKANPQGPKLKWVPKGSPSVLHVQETNKSKDEPIGQEKGKIVKEVVQWPKRKQYGQRRKNFSTKTSHVQKGGMTKSKTCNEKRWVKKNVSLINKPKVSTTHFNDYSKVYLDYSKFYT